MFNTKRKAAASASAASPFKISGLRRRRRRRLGIAPGAVAVQAGGTNDMRSSWF